MGRGALPELERKGGDGDGQLMCSATALTCPHAY
jgi:hypothetical protein